ncbi:hypothetical protein GW17_00005442 [Ensete ventricosum]|nr:hypothetical protein GW17_00005442 [Ensete ventricosum]RZR91518.1 hypothetical protein BHM03_00019627 [Ensete ventricosum]
MRSCRWTAKVNGIISPKERQEGRSYRQRRAARVGGGHKQRCHGRQGCRHRSVGKLLAEKGEGQPLAQSRMNKTRFTFYHSSFVAEKTLEMREHTGPGEIIIEPRKTALAAVADPGGLLLLELRVQMGEEGDERSVINHGAGRQRGRGSCAGSGAGRKRRGVHEVTNGARG